MQRAVSNVFSTDPKEIEQQQTLDSEGAVITVLNGTKGSNQRTTNTSDRLIQEGLNSTVPPINAGRADRDDYPDTVITAYNGAAASKPETIKLLQDLFDVTVLSADDPSQTADIVIIVGKSSPNLKPRSASSGRSPRAERALADLSHPGCGSRSRPLALPERTSPSTKYSATTFLS